MNELTAKRNYPKSPLGIIALFVFLIEAISPISLKILVAAQSPFVGYIVAFTVLFPVIIVLLFFITLWFRRESFYTPTDFRNDASFLQLFTKLNTLELKQEAAQVDPQGSDTEHVLPIIRRLLELNEFQSAISLGKPFLKVARFSTSFQIFQFLEARIPTSSEFHSKALALLAYSLIGQQKYLQAVDVLLRVTRETNDSEFGFWPALGLAYSYLKTGNLEECQHWLLHAKQRPQALEYASLAARLYPEFGDEFPIRTDPPRG